MNSSAPGAGLVSDRRVMLSCDSGWNSLGGGGDDARGSGPGGLCLEDCREGRTSGGGGMLGLVFIMVVVGRILSKEVTRSQSAEDGEGTPPFSRPAAYDGRAINRKWGGLSEARPNKQSVAERLLITSQCPVIPTRAWERIG